jgi:GNAT superfamily N-acetyltransferase
MHNSNTVGTDLREMNILEYKKDDHLDGLRECVIELQDAEHELVPRLPTGAEIVDAYLPEMFERCASCDGKVLVADVDGEVAGYATILTRVTSEDIADGGLEYALVADLVTLSKHRRTGVGRKLLEAAEDFARERGSKWLRIGVLAANQGALNLYDAQGFSRMYVELEKDLGRKSS